MKLAELVGIVAGSRARTADVFPLPDAPDCVDYAICEAAETLDAILREKRKGDKRNNDRQVNSRLEWGQCGYMIASGLMQTDYNFYVWEDEQSTIYHVLHWLAQEAVEGDESLVSAMASWSVYCQWCGWAPAELLRETCANFERKHLKTAEALPLTKSVKYEDDGDVLWA